MALATSVKGHLSPDPACIISELLWDVTSTERKIILHWINEVLTSDDPGLRISMMKVHGSLGYSVQTQRERGMREGVGRLLVL